MGGGEEGKGGVASSGSSSAHCPLEYAAVCSSNVMLMCCVAVFLESAKLCVRIRCHEDGAIMVLCK